MSQPLGRSAFLKQSASLLGLAAFGRLPDISSEHTHPEPRPGITSERVLAADAIGAPRREKEVFAAYDAARAYPELFDGLSCACGCGEHRSLLVCYETKQPTGCVACQMEAQLVGDLAKEEKTLAEIRAAVDKKFKFR
jgi:hypothetical protein